MARIEQFIREHRSDFDMQEPDEGHFGRFAALLDQQESKPVHMINRGKILRIAAVILLLISLSAVVFDFATRSIRERFAGSESSFEVSDEINEAILYYDRQTQAKLAALGNLAAGSQEAGLMQSSVLKEIKNLDDATEDLKSCLRQNHGNERIQAAIIQNQQMKESILNNVLTRINIQSTK